MVSAKPQQKDVQALAEQILELSKEYDPKASYSGFEPKLMTKAKELITLTQSPNDFSTGVLRSMLEGSSMSTLLMLGAIQAIPNSEAISIQDLESKTGAQASLLVRLFRPLVVAGIINLNADGTYSHTATSAAYAVDGTPLAALFNHMFSEGSILTAFPDYFRARGAKEPEGELASTHNPRTWYYGQEGKTVFEILEQDPIKLKGFQQLMTMASRFRPWTGFYDFGKLATSDQDRAVFVDVGGADGSQIQHMLAAHPEIKPEQCVVQDRESVIEMARNNTNLPAGVQLQPHDFFTPQPIRNARAYFLRAICHDWSDTMAIRILSQLTAVAGKDTRILIGDSVLPEGPVSGMAAFMDLGMLCIGGKERTRRDWEFVLGEAGLEIGEIFPAGTDSGYSIIEASLK